MDAHSNDYVWNLGYHNMPSLPNWKCANVQSQIFSPLSDRQLPFLFHSYSKHYLNNRELCPDVYFMEYTTLSRIRAIGNILSHIYINLGCKEKNLFIYSVILHLADFYCISTDW